MLKVRTRSSRDGQVQSDLVPTAGRIGPDGRVGISSPSTLATTGIFRCKGIMGKSFDAGGEMSELEEERVL